MIPNIAWTLNSPRSDSKVLNLWPSSKSKRERENPGYIYLECIAHGKVLMTPVILLLSAKRNAQEPHPVLEFGGSTSKGSEMSYDVPLSRSAPEIAQVSLTTSPLTGIPE